MEPFVIHYNQILNNKILSDSTTTTYQYTGTYLMEV